MLVLKNNKTGQFLEKIKGGVTFTLDKNSAKKFATRAEASRVIREARLFGFTICT